MPQSPGPAPERAHAQVLADAVRILTEAARLTRPVWAPEGDRVDERWKRVWIETGEREPANWAEFVCSVLGAAAANRGGIEVALSGRPGSAEADRVRQLLTSQLGMDPEQLWAARTKPIRVTVWVPEVIPIAHDDAYDTADLELHTRLRPEVSAQDAAANEPVYELLQRLEVQRLEDLQRWGDGVREHIETAAAQLAPHLDCAVRIVIGYRNEPDRVGADDLVERLLEAALEDVALPGDGRSPLQRMGS